ncbi:MAG TPA: peptidoglycan recognition family protein [Nannocystaceae bacterium]|nr:peptidoglycan recognition family protein [Nannocystaceae bacterium]
MNVVNDLRDTKRPKGSRGEVKRKRAVAKIVGITLHQTATADFPPTHKGLPRLPAHALVHRDGSISLLHHPTNVVWHGNALNNGTIGIEVACRAAGTEGDLRTLWVSKKEKAAGKKPEQLVRESTDAQLAALDELIRHYIGEISTQGGSIRGLWAHRQGHSSRTSDPGSRIWSVAERLRVALGLVDVRDKVLGSGKTIGKSIPPTWRIDAVPGLEAAPAMRRKKAAQLQPAKKKAAKKKTAKKAAKKKPTKSR